MAGQGYNQLVDFCMTKVRQRAPGLPGPVARAAAAEMADNAIAACRHDLENYVERETAE